MPLISIDSDSDKLYNTQHTWCPIKYMCIMLSDVLVMSLVLSGFKWLIYQHSLGLLCWHLGQSYHCLIHCQETLKDTVNLTSTQPQYHKKTKCILGTYFLGCIVYPTVYTLPLKFLWECRYSKVKGNALVREAPAPFTMDLPRLGLKSRVVAGCIVTYFDMYSYEHVFLMTKYGSNISS